MSSPWNPMNDDTQDPNQALSDKEKFLERMDAYEKLGMYEKAIDECRAFVRRYPNDPEFIVELGILFDLKGEKAKALKYFKYANKKFPEYFRAYVALGYCFDKCGECNDMAMFYYKKALELNPNDEWAYFNIGRMLHYSNKWKEAIPFFEKSYKACKREGLLVGRSLHGLAWAYYRLKDYKKASRMFCRIAEEDVEYLEEQNNARADFGCVHYRLGLYDKALALLEEAVVRQPGNKRNSRLRELFYEKASASSSKHSKKLPKHR
mgnify:CR=1 FL=1